VIGRQRRWGLWRGERGVALVLTLLVLLSLSGLLAAYLAVAAHEPHISRNLSDASRSRYVAEAGIERAYNVLVATGDVVGRWSELLVGATVAQPWVAVDGLTNIAVGAQPNSGVFTVVLRNDNGPADTHLTGLSATTRPAMDASPNDDNNRTVIVRSTGTFNGVTTTIEAVVQRAPLPAGVPVSAEVLQRMRALHSITSWREL
jgi:Tfp pilus assembly protein PilX